MRQIVAMATVLTLVGCSAATGGGSPPASVSASASSALTPSSEPAPTPTLAPGVIQVFDLTVNPSGIVAAGDVIWAEDHSVNNKVYALDPDTGETLASVSVTRPCDIAAAFDRIWVADLEGGSLLWIDPATQEIGGEIDGFHGPCGVQAVDGAVWLAVDNGLARVNPDSEEVTITELGDGAFPGAGVPLWAALYGNGDLVPIDTATGDAGRVVPYPDGPTEGPPLATGFGSLWVGSLSGDRLFRLDAKTGKLKAEIEATTPSRILVTADAIWTTSYPMGVVERIDPMATGVAP